MQLATGPNYCGHCGGYHTGICPKIKVIEYHLDGSIKRIEYHGELQPMFINQPLVK